MTETKTNFVDKIADVLTPVAAKMQEMHLISALAETMQAVMPITIIGSFACLAAFLDLGGYQAFLANHPAIMTIAMSIQSLTLSCFALYVLLLLPYLYANKLGMKQSLTMIPLSLAAFLLITPHELYTNIHTEWLGNKGLLSAILISFVVVRVAKFFIDKKICLRMPAGVPKFVEEGFGILVPAAVIWVTCAIVQHFMATTSFGSVHMVIYTILQKPFQTVGLSLIGQTVTETMATLCMFLGLHANTVIGVVEPLRYAAAAENLAAWQAGLELPNIAPYGFTNLSLIGAGGSCLSATLAFLIFSKSKRYQSVARIAVLPGIFGVGEPILFGLPIMLNPTAFIPFIGVVIFNQIYAYTIIAIGLVGKFTGATIHWTCPPFLNMILSSSTPVRACIALAIELVINLLIWYPFVKMMDKEALAEEAEAAEK
ncbi:MAG: PTS sugar transporter subunit IIC [Erysipelotrichaceae bacterium]|nr:PTS sugar transporter subunit IIC [Erysipelotrichaceae bacterium]